MLKLHKVEIRQKKENFENGDIMIAENTEVSIDGKLIDGIKEIDFHVGADEIAHLRIDMYANVVVMGNFNSPEKKGNLATDGQ